MQVALDATASANVAIVQSIYAAFGRGDAAFIAGRLAHDTTWTFAVGQSDVPWHRPARGAAGVAAFLDAFVSNVTLEAFEPRHFVASGQDVIAHIGLDYTVKRTGRRVSGDQLHWWTIRDGRVASLRHFEDTAQVISAWTL